MTFILILDSKGRALSRQAALGPLPSAPADADQQHERPGPSRATALPRGLLPRADLTPRPGPGGQV